MRGELPPLVCYLVNKAAGALLWLSLPLVRLRSALRLWLGRPASVWGTTPIVTLPLLARVDRLLGFRSESVVHTTYHVTTAFDRVLKDQFAAVNRRAPGLLPAFYRLVLLRTLLRYDVIHLFYDQGFLEREGRFGLRLPELRWYRRARKRVYLYAYGADVRARQTTLALGPYNCCTHCDRAGEHCICDDAEAQAKQAVYRRHATALLSTGDMMAYVPGARDLYYWPFDVERCPYVGVRWDGKRPLKVLHVPNHEWAKGSRYLHRALEALCARNIAFEYLQVSQVSNQEVLQLMGEADVIADQFLIGWHGYTALEALARGKVVLCYIRDRRMLLNPDECPILSANPDELEQVLSRLAASSPERLRQLGQAGRLYIERHYSLPAMAGRLADLYLETGSFPARTARRIRRHADVLQAQAAIMTGPCSGPATNGEALE